MKMSQNCKKTLGGKIASKKIAFTMKTAENLVYVESTAVSMLYDTGPRVPLPMWLPLVTRRCIRIL